MDMSRRAYAAITDAEVIVGYHGYLEFVQELIGDKKVIGSGMTQEIDRCQAAVEEALSGKSVAVISSGDAGIYGMAGLALELVMKYPPGVRPKVDIIPGISAICSAAAVLGAPLMHDFAVVSLSDLLTPWDTIIKRLEAVAASDFVVALYNPKSKRRVKQIETAREIMLRYRVGTVPVGIVHNASRPNQRVIVSDLDKFTHEHIDMLSLVIIGNSQTYVQDGRMITPRGYLI
jgi:precorrin-3B C17-methyltransferase